MFKNKKPFSGKKGIFYLVLGTFVAKLLSSYFKKKTPDMCQNFRNFLHKEKNEIKELATGKESFGRYCQDSCSLFKDYFIPHKCNGHKPKILRTRSLAVIAIMLISLKVAVGGYLFLTYPNEARMSENVVNKVLLLVNSERVAQGLNELELNPSLSKFALDKANDLIAKDYFAHYSPDGKKPWDFIDRSEYKYLFVGENLAMNFTTADSVHRALMNSESHKHNILNDRYDDVGLAMATGVINGRTTNVLVQFFATRNSPHLASETTDVRTAGTTDLNTDVAIKEVEAVRPTEVPVEEKEAQTEPVPLEVKEEINPVSAERPVDPAPEVIENTEKEAVVEPEKPDDSAPARKINNEEFQTEVAAAESTDSFIENSSVVGQPKLETKILKVNEELVNTEPEIVMDYNKKDPVVFKTSVSPNTDIDNYKMIETKSFANEDETFALTAMIVKITRYVFITILALVCLALVVNIVVRLEVQHHSVIIQTLFLLILISGLLYMRTHFLDSTVTDLLII